MSLTAMMSATAIFSSFAMPNSDAASNATRASRQASARILSSLPTTRSTSAMPANISGWVCAAQPVTTMRKPGRSRFSRRIDCRACGTASLVTAQLLMTMVSVSPARSASRAITSDSKELRRQPKVAISTLIALGDVGKQSGIEAAFIFEGRRARHQDVVVAFAPFDRKLAARQRNRDGTIGALEPRRGDGRRAGRRAAGLCQAGAALPGQRRDVAAVHHMGQRDIGTLRKNRMIFEERPEAAEIVGVDVVDPEDRMRITHRA